MEPFSEAGASNKRVLPVGEAGSGEAPAVEPGAGPPPSKREKLQDDLEPTAVSVSEGGDKQTCLPSVGSAALPVDMYQRAPVVPGRSGVGGHATAALAAKQQALLRKHVLVADPSLASQESLLDQVATVMKETWSWEELRKFFLRKNEMRENVQATLELIRDDLAEDEQDDGLPGPMVAEAGNDHATESVEEGEVLEVTPAAAPEPPVKPVADDRALASASAAVAPSLPIDMTTSTARPPPILKTVSAAIANHPSQATPEKIAPVKKKLTKHLPSEQVVQLAREKALASGKPWIEPAKKKAMMALRTETEAQLERGEFHTFEAEDKAGRKFTSIRSVRTLAKKARCSIIAVVVSCDIRPPARTDALASIKLQDPTGSIALNAFAKSVESLPQPSVGSIIFLRNIYVEIWQGIHTVVGAAMDGYEWAYADLKVSSMTCPARLDAQYGSPEVLTASQHSYAQKLSSWARFSLGMRESAPGAEPVIAENAPLKIAAKKKRSRMAIDELTETTEFFDLVAQIVKVGAAGAETRDIFVTDFTSNPRLFKYDLRAPPLVEAQKPSEPFGRYCLKVSIFQELAKTDNSSLAVGKLVKFRNAKVRMRDYLEVSLWGDRNSGCRIERLGQADEGVAELLERRAVFAQALYAEQGEDPPSKTSGALLPQPRSWDTPWEKPPFPVLNIREAVESFTFCCFGQVVAISQSFQAPEDGQFYRSFKVTDFTAHPRIRDEPEGDPGSPSAPPKRAFGRYTLRILLSGDDAIDKRADAWRSGDYLFFIGLRVNGKGGRGLEAYFHTDGQPQPYPIAPVPSPCAALGPLLLQKNAFYSRLGSPIPEQPISEAVFASPLLPPAEDGDVAEDEPLDTDLDNLLSKPGPKGSAPLVDRSCLLQHASITSVIDGVFQIVKTHAVIAGQTSLLVTDWTEHALNTERFPPLPNPEVVHVEEPFGRYVLEVQVLHQSLLADRDFLDALAPGAFVRLRGLLLARSPGVGIRGHLTKSHDSSWERMREESQEPEVLALLSRRAATYQLSATQITSAPDASEAPSPPATGTLPEEVPEAALAPLATAGPSDHVDVEMEGVEGCEDSIDIYPTQSLLSSERPTTLESVLGAPWPAKHTIRARVVDYLPKKFEDVVVCICRACNLILPTEDRVCRSCMSQHDASLGRDLHWTYRLMLKLKDGSATVWAALYHDDFTALFPSLPPASDYCDAATQIIDSLASQLAVLHPAIGTDQPLDTLSGPTLELSLKRTAAVSGLEGVGDHSVAAFRIFRTILRDRNDGA